MCKHYKSFFHKHSFSIPCVVILSLIVCVVLIETCDRSAFRNKVNYLTGIIMEDTVLCHFADTLNAVSNPSGIEVQTGISALELLKAYESSAGLLTSNGLTYLVTLIVALLATLLLYRIQEVESLVRKNKRLEDEITSLTKYSSSYNNVLIRLESVYDLTMIISSFTLIDETLGDNSNKSKVYTKIGSICSRISIILDAFKDEQDGFLLQLRRIRSGERQILNMYLADTQDVLKQVSKSLKDVGQDIYKNVDAIEKRLKTIEYLIDKIPSDGKS